MVSHPYPRRTTGTLLSDAAEAVADDAAAGTVTWTATPTASTYIAAAVRMLFTHFKSPPFCLTCSTTFIFWFLQK